MLIPRRSPYPFLYALLLTPSLAAPPPLKPEAAPHKLDRLPVYFEPNLGQFDPQVRFVVRGAKYQAWITDTEMVLAFPSKTPAATTEPRTHKTLWSDLVRIRFGMQKPTAAVGLDNLSSYSNYFLNDDPTKWRSRVPNFARARLDNVYPGIDIVFYGSGRDIEYDLIVKPGADPSLISLDFQAPAEPTIDPQGGLSIQAGAGTLLHHAPVAFQEGRLLQARAVFDNGRLGFRLGRFDRTHAITIDPLLEYSTYLGGASDEDSFWHGIAANPAGEAYVTGYTYSSSFPVTAGAFQQALTAGSDVFVAKLNAAGTALIYSTFVGGSAFDEGLAIAIDPAGQAFVTGATNSSNFPTANAHDPSHNGDYDAFALKLDAAGAGLLYSTYLGGSSTDQANAIALDSSGNAYLAGYTASGDFPATVGSFDTTSNGSWDAFAAKLDPSGTPVYSTFLGGPGSDQANGIAVDSAGSAYVAGFTLSGSGFPTTPGAFDASPGGQDAFVTKLSPAGDSLAYSTFLGGSASETGRGIVVDASGDAFVTGDTLSTGFPVTPGAYDSTQNGGSDAFVAKINPAGSGLIYATFLGATSTDVGYDVAIDASGQAYVTGLTYSTNFPTTVDAYDTSANGSADIFLAQFTSTGGLAYSTYLGGSTIDFATGIAATPSGKVYIAGYTAGNYPTTAGVVDTTFNGGFYDVFVTRFSFGVSDFTPPVISPNVSPGANAAGWNNTAVNVSWSVTDPESSIDSTSGCGPVTLAADTPPGVTTLTCSATSAGGTSSLSVTIRIDLTPPGIAGSRTPPPNASGWNNTNVDVNFTCTDTLSGVASSGALITRMAEGPGQSAAYTCFDLAGNSSSLAVAGINIDKTPPQVLSQTLSPSPVTINVPVSVEASLADAGSSGLALANYRIGANPYSLLAPASGASAIVTGSIGSISDPALADVCVQAVDLAGNLSPESCQPLAAYDPSGSFVTAGGAFFSPPGAVAASPLSSGSGQITFQARYLPKAAVPTGNTQFKLKVAGFEFDAASYAWLIVSGPKAQYSGAGSVKGVAGPFQFTLTAIDGKLPGGGGIDKLRLRITGPGGVVYDSQPGAPGDALPTTVLTGGSIVIHK